MECQPLLEDQFSPIISNNYYEPRLFWFELERDQTEKLISMFSSVRITSSASLSKNMDKKTALSKPLHFPNGAQGGESVKTHLLNTNSYPNKANTEWGSSWDASGLGEESWISDPVFVDDNAEKNEDGVGLVEPNNWPSFSASQKTWSSLLKDSTRSDDRKGIEDIATLTQELNLSCTDQSNMEWDSYCFGPCSDEKRMCLEAAGEDSGKVYEQEGLRINNEIQHSSIMSEGTISFAKSTPYGVVTADDLKQDSKESRMATSEMNPYLTAERNSSCFVPDLVTESHPIDALVYEDGAEITEEEHVHFKSSGECTSSSAIIKENISKNSYCNDSVVDGMISDAIYSPEATLALETESSGGVQSIVARVIRPVHLLALAFEFFHTL